MNWVSGKCVGLPQGRALHVRVPNNAGLFHS